MGSYKRSKVASESKGLNIYFDLVNAVKGDLNYIHHSAYGG